MSKQFLIGVLSGASLVCALWFLLEAPLSLRASGNTVKPTPTVNRQVNARFLQNRRAKDFMPTTEANQFLSWESAPGLAKAGVYAICNDSNPTIFRSFNLLTDEPIQIGWVATGTCTLTFSYLPSNSIILATASSGVVNVEEQANIVTVSIQHLDGTPAQQYFSLLVY